jgi:hypothetical protein
VLFGVLIVAAIVAGYWIYRWLNLSAPRAGRVISWLREAKNHPEWAIKAGERCGDAPFVMPTDGFIGFLWGDSFQFGHRHQGIDIFGGADVDVIPVIAAYPGFLTRLPDWKSSVIVRIPEDPLHPDRQIWTYYTHMANPQGESYIDSQFPPGTNEMYIVSGTLLGYQGNYSGDPGNPVGVHLHFSIVLDDGKGRFLNELDIQNTLDPSLYLGLPLNASENRGEIPVCSS